MRAESADLHSVFSSAIEYAALAGRPSPTVFDLAAAQEEVGSLAKLHKSSKKRRKGVLTVAQAATPADGGSNEDACCAASAFPLSTRDPVRTA